MQTFRSHPTGRGLLALGLFLTILNASAATLHVWQDSPSPSPPYGDWASAARTIQEAVDAAQTGDTVLVTNGLYATGGRAVAGTMTNRVVIDKPIRVESVNGPADTLIIGAEALGGGNGDGAVRCVYLGPDAVLSGFTLTNGHTRASGDFYEEEIGGGVWCESGGVLTNCVLTGNSACEGGGAFSGTLYNCTLTGNWAEWGGGAYCSTLHDCTLTGNSALSSGGGAFVTTLHSCILAGNVAGSGGGAAAGTLYHCVLAGNSADWSGGGASYAMLYNCSLTGNSASGPEPAYSGGGGADGGTLHNCTLTANVASGAGGGACAATLYGCTVTGNSAQLGGGASGCWRFDWGEHLQPCRLYNSIVYHNTAQLDANYSSSTFEYCCTSPLPAEGIGNIDDDPQLASATHLLPDSPCVGAGSTQYTTGVDIDGEPWADPPCIGADQVLSPAAGLLAVQIEVPYSQVAVGFPVRFVAHNQGPVLAMVWNFGDGTVVSNQAYLRHGWVAPGRYTVSLTGYNDSSPEGVTATVSIEVTDAVYYVDAANSTPAYPYATWETAATTIQDAIGAGMLPGRLVLVRDGVYESGGVAVAGSLTNRVVLTNAVVVRSVNGPGVTVISGAGPLGDGAVRSAYVGNDAILSGFTLTNGHTQATGDYSKEQSGGGVWCEWGGVVTNCVLTANWAESDGGGAYGGTLHRCTLTGNSAWRGGGAYGGTLYNCVLTGNSATGDYGSGGGAYEGTLCNCIVYFNSASSGPNYAGSTTFDHSCTTPLPLGEGNIDGVPLFVDSAAGNFRLAYGSPCIDAGSDLRALLTTDLDDNPRPLDGDGDGLAAFDMGAYELDLRALVPTSWFLQYGLDPADPQVVSGNPDHDGQTTFQEWLADTDPTNRLSCFRIDHIEVSSNGAGATVWFRSSSNRVYTLGSAPHLPAESWATVPGQMERPGRGGLDTLSDTNSAPRRFYRIGVKLP